MVEKQAAWTMGKRPAGAETSFAVTLSCGFRLHLEHDDCVLGISESGDPTPRFAHELEPGDRIAPPAELAPGEGDLPDEIAGFSRRYRDGAAVVPYIGQLPGERLRAWRHEYGDDNRAMDLQLLVKELHLAGARLLTREVVYAWEEHWRVDSVESGPLGLVGGPASLAELRALAIVTEDPVFNAIYAAAAFGHTSVERLHRIELADQEESAASLEQLQQLPQGASRPIPPWWPIVTAVAEVPGPDAEAEPARTLASSLAGPALAGAVAAMLETQRLYADNRVYGSAPLWVYLPRRVSVSGWTWARHNTVGKWGMFTKKQGSRADLMAQLAVAYADEHGVDGLIALVTQR